MEFIIFSIVLIFAVYGAAVIVKRWICRFTACGGDDKIIIYVKSNEQRIEAVVRSLMVNNPCAEIIVVDEGKSESMREILDKLCVECARLHIKRRS